MPECGSNPACQVVGTGLTSIIDITFGVGVMYVVDEAGFLAAELGAPTTGTVNACSVGVTISCSVLAGGLPIPTAATGGKDGTVWATILSLVPGSAAVVPLN
jgi:hypothetical protein